MASGDMKCGDMLQPVAQTAGRNGSSVEPFLIFLKACEKRKKLEMSYGSATITVMMVAVVLCVYVLAVKLDLL
jgi:hypothetical protein